MEHHSCAGILASCVWLQPSNSPLAADLSRDFLPVLVPPVVVGAVLPMRQANILATRARLSAAVNRRHGGVPRPACRRDARNGVSEFACPRPYQFAAWSRLAHRYADAPALASWQARHKLCIDFPVLGPFPDPKCPPCDHLQD